MNLPAASERLRRLTNYLAQDPDNQELLAEACDAALSCGRFDAAGHLLDSADRLAPRAPAWQLRRAHWCIARRDLEQARTLLEGLRGQAGDHPVLLHDLAHLHLLQGDAQAAFALLEPGRAQDFAGPGMPQELLQVQWLRACHRLGRLDEAFAWAERAHAGHALQPAAAGVASLVALDLDEVQDARRFADVALAAEPRQHEALVTRGCLALAAGELGEARRDLELAVADHPEDGRSRSSLGLANLLAGDVPGAREQLECAVALAPSHGPSWQALGWARLLLGEEEQALEAFRVAVQMDDGSAEVHAALALATALAGDAAAARPFLAHAEALDPADETVQLARACLAAEGRSLHAEEALQRLRAQWRPRP